MDRKKGHCFWKDASKEDINNIKFIELLLKYNYTWYRSDNEMKLNLSETDKRRFLKECSESIEYVDEIKASLIIEIIRHEFNKEYFRLQKSRRNDDEPIFPWFSQAYRLFLLHQPSISEVPPITSSYTRTVATDSNTPPNKVPEIITHTSTPVTASLSSTSTVEPFSWTTILPNWKLPSLGQEKQLANPFYSQKDGYCNQSSLRKVKPQYGFPVIYPVCILPCFSLGRSGEDSNTFDFRNESKFLSSNEIPFNLSSSSHQHISDISYLPGNAEIPNPANSIRPDSHCLIAAQNKNSSVSASPLNSLKHIVTDFAANDSFSNKMETFLKSHCSQMINQNVYSSQPASSLNTLQQVGTNFTASNCLQKEPETLTNYQSFRVPFQSPTSKISPVSRGAIASGTRAKLLTPKRRKYTIC